MAGTTTTGQRWYINDMKLAERIMGRLLLGADDKVEKVDEQLKKNAAKERDSATLSAEKQAREVWQEIDKVTQQMEDMTTQREEEKEAFEQARNKFAEIHGQSKALEEKVFTLSGLLDELKAKLAEDCERQAVEKQKSPLGESSDTQDEEKSENESENEESENADDDAESDVDTKPEPEKDYWKEVKAMFGHDRTVMKRIHGYAESRGFERFNKELYEWAQKKFSREASCSS
jgi:chromosome segregation ATPase